MWPFNTSHLPFANGPYIPGCVDLMTEYSRDGLFVRFYYPTNEVSNIKNYINQWTPWIPHDSYIRGFARVVMVWVIVVRFVLWLVSGRIYVPAIYGAPIKKDKKLKCILFSHGLGGGRFLYSQTCIELASRGFLVVCIEHRDDSSCNTYYYKSKDDAKNDIKTFIDYVPIKLGPNHYIKRNSQVNQRASECTKTFNLLKDINSGKIPHNVLDDCPSEKNTNFKLNDLTGILDVDDMSMMGHSFGAATSLLTLTKNPQIRRGIILDAWMFPIKDVDEVLTEMKQPLIFINTQTFHIASNVKMMENIVEKNVEQRSVYTILHTTHENQTDTVFAAGYWLNWFMKKLSAENAIHINNALILKWLFEQSHCPSDVSDCETYLHLESHNYREGLDALKKIIEIQYKSVFKMFT